MRSCEDCVFMTDYGEFMYCKIKEKIIRHEKRDAIFCKYYKLIFPEGEAIQEFAEALAEFLNNYPEGEENGLSAADIILSGNSR